MLPYKQGILTILSKLLFLRASLNKALQKETILTHKKLASTVVKYMGLSQADYAETPSDSGSGKRRNEEAFEHLIEYRLYEDLKRGWRIVQPNLEQSGLLTIEYDGLKEHCNNQSAWEKTSSPYSLKSYSRTTISRCDRPFRSTTKKISP